MRGLWRWTAVLAGGLPWLATGGNAQDLASLGSVQDLVSTLPQCALTCLTSAILGQNECAFTDVACICSNEKITAASEPCIRSQCSVRDALVTQRLQADTCGLPVRNKASLIKQVQWSGIGIAIAMVAFRFLAKLPVWKGPEIWWDDWSILATLAVCTASDVVLDRMVNNGLGQDIWMLSPEQITKVQKDYWINAFLYVSVMHGVKISILLLYIRIFPSTGVPRWFTIVCYGTMAALAASWLGLVISNAAACNPIEFNWLQWDGEHRGECINQQGLIFASAGINVFFDIAIFLIPLPIVIPLQVSTYRKLGAVAVFSLGLFVTVCSIIRLQFLFSYGNSTNPTWDNTPLALWSAVEGNWAIVCASMPSMARPIKLGWRKVRGWAGQYSAGSGSTMISSRPTTPRSGHAPQRHQDWKGFQEQRQYPRPVRSFEDMELAHHPVTRHTSLGS